MEKQVAIIGAGVSGLLACKYSLEKGFNPVVFEADDECIGGVWAHTTEFTRLQTSKRFYQFSDFPWPNSVADEYPTSTQLMEYIESYAKHFGIFPCMRFNSKVLGVDYVGESFEEMEFWELWGGSGQAFGSRGKWHITVQNTKDCTIKIYQVEFIILCIGEFSGLPNIPTDFPPDKGPEMFKGKVMHSMDYAAMNNSSAAALIKGKRITIIGSHKSAVDLAAECANMNGVEYPCTIIQRTAHWFIPSEIMNDPSLGFFHYTRFSELLFHKPGEPLLLSFLATLLSPLRWGISKLLERYLLWISPLKKYGMVPKYSFNQDMSACNVCVLPDKFYDKVEEGSIVIKNSQSFSFYKNGLMIKTGGETQLLETDMVIFTTGFKGDEKLGNIFESPIFQEQIMGSPSAPIPLYRQIIHPRIPQLAIIGHGVSLSSLCSSEIKCQWLAHFLDGKIKLPSIRDMEKEAKMWGDHIKQGAGKYFRRSCICNMDIWYNDQLCKDMGCNPRRKKGFFADLFVPYVATDYAALLHK